MEMALDGLRTVATGQVPYRGLVHEPETLGEYEAILLGVHPIEPVEQAAVELFAYFYFIKACLPWSLTHKVYGDNFRGFAFNSLDDILPGVDGYLDHVCDWILNPEATVLESWS